MSLPILPVVSASSGTLSTPMHSAPSSERNTDEYLLNRIIQLEEANRNLALGLEEKKATIVKLETELKQKDKDLISYLDETFQQQRSFSSKLISNERSSTRCLQITIALGLVVLVKIAKGGI